MTKFYVAIAGNIGVGKSTLTEKLSRELHWEPFYEAVNDNPYLADFYRDMRAWSFHSQVYFLSRRLQHHHELNQRPGSVVQDRTVYEDAEVFARNLYQQGLMAPRDYYSYHDLYAVVSNLLPPPTLVVYLRASVETLLHRIALRGRPYERSIAPEYLEQLNTLYEGWVGAFRLCPVLTISVDELDFVQSDAHMHTIIDQVLTKLGGRQLVLPNGG